MPVVHFKNFWGPGALCFTDDPSDARTPLPERVTCRECLALMGRASWPHEDEDVPLVVGAAAEHRARRA